MSDYRSKAPKLASVLMIVNSFKGSVLPALSVEPDVVNMRGLWEKTLGGKFTCHKNKTAGEMETKLHDFSNEMKHDQKHDYFVVIIRTHGGALPKCWNKWICQSAVQAAFESKSQDPQCRFTDAIEEILMKHPFEKSFEIGSVRHGEPSALKLPGEMTGMRQEMMFSGLSSEKEQQILGDDGKGLREKEMLRLFKNVSKPVMFILDYCGEGKNAEINPRYERIIIRSRGEYQLSYGDAEKGSFFISALKEVVEARWREDSLRETESEIQQFLKKYAGIYGKKQAPVFLYYVINDFYFTC